MKLVDKPATLPKTDELILSRCNVSRFPIETRVRNKKETHILAHLALRFPFLLHGDALNAGLVHALCTFFAQTIFYRTERRL